MLSFVYILLANMLQQIRMDYTKSPNSSKSNHPKRTKEVKYYGPVQNGSNFRSSYLAHFESHSTHYLAAATRYFTWNYFDGPERQIASGESFVIAFGVDLIAAKVSSRVSTKRRYRFLVNKRWIRSIDIRWNHSTKPLDLWAPDAGDRMPICQFLNHCRIVRDVL